MVSAASLLAEERFYESIELLVRHPRCGCERVKVPGKLVCHKTSLLSTNFTSIEGGDSSKTSKQRGKTRRQLTHRPVTYPRSHQMKITGRTSEKDKAVIIFNLCMAYRDESCKRGSVYPYFTDRCGDPSMIAIVNTPVVCASAHNTEHQIGAINSGALFRTFPTAPPTFQAFISSAGYGLSKSIGGCVGSPGSSHRL